MAPQFGDVGLRHLFWNKVSVEPNSGCWLWTGATTRDGYGKYNKVLSHRLSYEKLIGKVPVGRDLDHLCRVRCCVNPSHCEPVTPRENTLRGVSFAAKNAAKTTCPRGHNLPAPRYFNSRSYRACQICARAAEARYRARKAARHQENV